MAIVGGLDIHRRQITYDWIDIDTGETRRGQLSPATRLELRAWLTRFTGQQADFALEATTGWRFVAEELERAGIAAHLAEPADTRALRGPKRRAKTDRADANHLRELLRAGTLPESWMPPAQIADARPQVRLRRGLVGERTGWYQRIHPLLFHHGLPERSPLLTADGRAWLASTPLPVVARQAVEPARRMIDHLEVELDLLDTQLARIARAQPGCKALQWRSGPSSATCAASPTPARRSASVAWTSPSRSRTASEPAGTWPARAPRCCAGHCTRRPWAPPGRAPPTTPTTSRSNSAWAASGRRCRWPASWPARPTTPHENSAIGRWSPPACRQPPELVGIVRVGPTDQLMWCGQLPDAPAATRAVGGLHRTSGRTCHVRGTRSPIMSPDQVRAPR
jgi:hypothetical protein